MNRDAVIERAAKMFIYVFSLMAVTTLVIFFFTECSTSDVPDAISVDEALRSVDLTDEEKSKIRLIQEIRAFAESKIGLRQTDNYTTYYDNHADYWGWGLFAAAKDSLEPYPFDDDNGRAYITFTDLGEAKLKKQMLVKSNLDVFISPALAYSSRGLSVDPILRSMLSHTEAHLAMIIIHELTHATIHRRGREYTSFCESLAEFIGDTGTVQFFQERYPSDQQKNRLVADWARDRHILREFFLRSAVRLRELYASKPDDAETARTALFDQIIGDFYHLRPQFSDKHYRRYDVHELNNAQMAARLIYSQTEPFEEAFQAVNRDWPKFLAAVSEALKDKRPFQRLKIVTSIKK